MANRKMESVEVYDNDEGNIVVKNEVIGTDDCFVTLSPDQAELVCQWILEVRDEIHRKQKTFKETEKKEQREPRSSPSNLCNISDMKKTGLRGRYTTQKDLG